MSRKPPHRPGITFEIGARLEALDYLQKWYPSRIEKIDYEEGKMLVHFERWSHRYDEWIYWDSNRLRPLERPSLRKEGLKDDEFIDFKPGEEVLARWTDCRYYPAKIEAINKEGTFTVQFYDGVIRCLKRIHIKSMPEDAKGQDWIALVKAAAVAAAKNKAGVKPRTSANSNKDKEERKWFKVPSKKEETSTSAIVQKVQKKEEQPTSSETFAFPLVDVPKIAFVQAENALAHKRKNNLGNSFQAKRARLNKITGLLASKAVWADGAEKKEDRKEAAPVLEQEISPKPQSQKKNEADISSSANIQKSALLPSNLSSGKSRSKRCKQESGDSAGCLKPLKTPFSPELIQVEDLTLVSQLPSSGINKTNYSDFEDSSLDYFDGCSSPFTRSSGSSLTLRSTTTEKSTSYQYPRAILSVDLSGENLSDMEFLDDSSTESLLLSGDEYNQDFDSTNFEESQDEEDALNEIVRCICEMDEEKGFMIQCEECLCWQHSACMGLLEDSIPEQYICYICRDPPGQRWSAKYLCDKDWLNNGHMCGLSFLKENYSHLNAKKIVSTHRLLADVYGVTEILHGLQLKIGILKNKYHPDLHLWACTGVRKDHDQITVGIERRVVTVPEAVNPSGRTCHSQNHKEPPRLAPKMEETYIRSEHSYQKPGFGQDCKPVVDPTSSEDDDAGSFEQNQERLYFVSMILSPGVDPEITMRNRLFITSFSLSLFFNTVLESWLDFTGELEPPDPLARLPQLKRRIKQLISDMSKVQQIATLCSV
uniref:PHD finger protein 20-like protein 1 n=1 Tax=Pseudonaja textilis TaxID=8673 RepID=A0A670YFE5_PSETE